MALVSYGSSGESDLSGNEEEATENIYQANSDTVMSKNPSENKHQKESLSVNVISDEEDISPVNTSTNIEVGDNRDESGDSRVLRQIGYVPEDHIIGQARLIWFSTKAEWWEIWKWPFSIRFSRIGKKID